MNNKTKIRAVNTIHAVQFLLKSVQVLLSLFIIGWAMFWAWIIFIK